MARIVFPYGKNPMEVDIPDGNLVGDVHPKYPPAVKDEFAEIERALENPIGSIREDGGWLGFDAR